MSKAMTNITRFISSKLIEENQHDEYSKNPRIRTYNFEVSLIRFVYIEYFVGN